MGATSCLASCAQSNSQWELPLCSAGKAAAGRSSSTSQIHEPLCQSGPPTESAKLLPCMHGLLAGAIACRARCAALPVAHLPPQHVQHAENSWTTVTTHSWTETLVAILVPTVHVPLLIVIRLL